MRLNLVNNIVNDFKQNKLIQSFIKDLQNYINNKKEDTPLVNPIHDENKIITKYRDKMLIERAHILNDYAQQTLDKGEMYYIYSENSKIEEKYNLCICEKEKSHIVIEEYKENLPQGAKIGSVLRKINENYILDEEISENIEIEIQRMKSKILEEQNEFLESKRIEGHIYEMSEKNDDRAWLFDITNESNEGVEEIDFPKELLKESQEGDLFIYKNGEYQKNM